MFFMYFISEFFLHVCWEINITVAVLFHKKETLVVIVIILLPYSSSVSLNSFYAGLQSAHLEFGQCCKYFRESTRGGKEMWTDYRKWLFSIKLKRTKTLGQKSNILIIECPILENLLHTSLSSKH